MLNILVDGECEFGCNQENYTTFWKRMAGCGPSVVATLCGYHRWRHETAPRPFDDWLELMDDVWDDVTPTMQGLPSTRHLTERIEQYLTRRHPELTYASLDIPAERAERPTFEDFREFIVRALENDRPVAFLTLDNAGVVTLDDWHWTVIVGIDYGDDHTQIVDYNCGLVFDVPLDVWYERMERGGGVVQLTVNN
jgi:hypothetical protein